jgi:hypothetical protein
MTTKVDIAKRIVYIYIMMKISTPANRPLTIRERKDLETNQELFRLFRLDPKNGPNPLFRITRIISEIKELGDLKEG